MRALRRVLSPVGPVAQYTDQQGERVTQNAQMHAGGGV